MTLIESLKKIISSKKNIDIEFGVRDTLNQILPIDNNLPNTE